MTMAKKFKNDVINWEKNEFWQSVYGSSTWEGKTEFSRGRFERGSDGGDTKVQQNSNLREISLKCHKKIIRLLRHFQDILHNKIFHFFLKKDRDVFILTCLPSEKSDFRPKYLLRAAAAALEDYKTHWFIQLQIIFVSISGSTINKTFFLIKHYSWNCWWFVG